ncbi:T9SS type A sorting domain-containing protein [Portibacter lacus]|uniref:Secretion system C-terminal sorting domain-containing protein n=1 Tax=Portibacter lacus TaxID=1099794 RepID=A0AA37SQI6_9BACT|nr:T9SS type A sorting domain-containing protein [Portibacter lacus]GLR16773.1 hypothetical protein GCM10007940_13880 [Portibacter lacus]
MKNINILFTLIICFIFQAGSALAQTGSPQLTSIQTVEDNDGVYASWVGSDTTAVGYRLYYATNDSLNSWALAADETTLTSDQTEISIASQSDFVDVPDTTVYHFRLVAVSGTGEESDISDTYSKSSFSGNDKVLIVDGFDRISGSYKEASHDFVTGYLIGLRNSQNLDISSLSHDKIAEDSTILSQYDLVVWFLGDNSTVDETFSTAEQGYVKAYLNNGGKLVVSGSELGWDLENKGSEDDKAFINQYLKAIYAGDGDISFTPASGIDSTIFEGLEIPFGVTYVEDYPDEFTPAEGATALLKYNAPGGNAAVGYRGLFPEGTVEGGVITMGITLETALVEDQEALLSKILDYFEIVQHVSAPSDPQLTSIQTVEGGDGVYASWLANPEPSFGGYRLYYATNDSLNSWALAADETTLTLDITEVSIASQSDFVDVPEGPVHHFRLAAVSVTGAESGFGDTYSRASNSENEKVLIVDGFDRTSGSYSEATHDFVTGYLMGLRNSQDLDISSMANEKIAEDSTVLNQFDLVIWFLGDESTVDETLTTAEQGYIKSYLQNGGKLVVSGSELGWDLDNKGSLDDKAFINEYLKAAYAEDGDASFSPATGIDSTVFAGVVVQFGTIYVEDYPDAFNPSEGATALMNYAAPGGTAAIGYKGLFPEGTEEGGVITTGITIESAPLADQEDLLRQILIYFEIGQDVVGTEELALSNDVQLLVYPNPSTSTSNLTLTSLNNIQGQAQLRVVSIDGKVMLNDEVQLSSNKTSISIPSEEWPTGTYIISVATDRNIETLQFIKL